jgi:nicotinic acid mononucleotide adenylyltransferase
VPHGQVLDQPNLESFRPSIHACAINDPLINTASSTEARARVKEGRDASELLAPSVLEYIHTSQLYLD